MVSRKAQVSLVSIQLEIFFRVSFNAALGFIKAIFKFMT